MKRLVLGTRGSDLARAQTAVVEKALREIEPELDIAVQIITTRGDQNNAGPQGRKGLFTGEIERALSNREIDVAVHSAKDLPSDTSDDLEICAVLPRAAVVDVLVTKTAASLDALPRGATIATGSVRRQHQLRWLRDDLEIVDLRGNVPTRLKKLAENSWAGIILARAGLDRLGLETEGEQQFQITDLPNEQFVPAGGQGIIAMQIRTGDEDTRRIVMQTNHEKTLTSLQTERAFLRLLHGDCGTPVGVFATNEDGLMRVHAQLFETGRTEPRAATLQKVMTNCTPEKVAAELLELVNGR